MTESAIQEHAEKDDQRQRIEAGRTGVHQPDSFLCCPGSTKWSGSDEGRAWLDQELPCDVHKKGPQTKTKGQTLEKDRTGVGIMVCVCVCVCVCTFSHSVVSDSLRPFGL